MRVKFTKFPEEFKKIEKDLIKNFKRIGRKGEYINSISRGDLNGIF